MKIICAVLSLLIIPIGAHADLLLKASDLEKLCSSAKEEDRFVCALVIKAYKDGFIEGVANGVMGTYKNDQDVRSLVGGMKAKDFLPKFNGVVKKSTCIQSVQVEDLTKSFSQYVRDNPAVRSEPFRTAMFKAIEKDYCGK